MIPTIAPLDSAGALLPSHYVTYKIDGVFRGGLGNLDGSKGIDYQDWHSTISGGNVVLTPQTSGSPINITVGAGLTAAAAAFDRGMNANVAYTQGGESLFLWFDTIANHYVTDHYIGVRNILCVHDDVRDSSAQSSDVIVTYQRGAGIFYRVERERYAIEHTAKVAAIGELLSFGMGSQWRLLWKTQP